MTASRSAPPRGSERPSPARRNTPSAAELEPRVATAVLHGHRVSYRTLAAITVSSLVLITGIPHFGSA